MIKYTTQLASSLNAVKAACPEADISVQSELLVETSDLLSDMKVALAALEQLTADSASIEDARACAHAYHDKVVPAMAALRTPADKLEMIVDKELWPFPHHDGAGDLDLKRIGQMIKGLPRKEVTLRQPFLGDKTAF